MPDNIRLYRRWFLYGPVGIGGSLKGYDMSCPTGKIVYDSRREARKAMRHINKVHNNDSLKYIYECKVCTKFHLTSMTKDQSENVEHDHTSRHVKELRKKVLVNKHEPSKKAIAGVTMYRNGKIEFFGSAKGFLYTTANGEDKFIMK